MKKPVTIKEILEDPSLGICRGSEIELREMDFYAFNRNKVGFRLEARTYKAVKVRMCRRYFWIPRGQVVASGNAILISKWWADRHLLATIIAHIHRENGHAKIFKVKIRRRPSIRERVERRQQRSK